MKARATPAVPSGRSVIESPPRSSNVYISLVTMSDVSPSVRAKTSVNSKIGVAISPKPYRSVTERARATSARNRRDSSGRRSRGPRTGCRFANVVALRGVPSVRRGFQDGSGPGARLGLGSLRLDLRGLFLDQPDQMVDQLLVSDLVVGKAGHIDHVRALAAAGHADVGLARFAGAVDAAADPRYLHRRHDVLQALFQQFDGIDDLELLPRAGRAGDDVDAAMAEIERLQHVEADLHLLYGIRRQRYPNGVADPRPEQHPQSDRRFHGADAEAAGLGDAEMERIVAGLGELLIGGHGEKDVRSLHADLELAEVVVFQNAGVMEGALHHRFRTRLAVTLQQFTLEAAGVDSDPHRAAMVLGGLDHLAHTLVGADVAGVDAQAGGARLGRLDGALVVEMDVGDDRHRHLGDDLLQCRSRLPIRTRHAHDVDARDLSLANLPDGRRGIRRRRVRHRLDADWRIATDSDFADMDLPAGTPVDVAIGPAAHAILMRSAVGSDGYIAPPDRYLKRHVPKRCRGASVPDRRTRPQPLAFPRTLAHHGPPPPPFRPPFPPVPDPQADA